MQNVGKDVGKVPRANLKYHSIQTDSDCMRLLLKIRGGGEQSEHCSSKKTYNKTYKNTYNNSNKESSSKY